MAAGHDKKRRSASSITSSQEEKFSVQKKRNVGNNLLNTRTVASLEWDDELKKVAAKREQIALSQRDKDPFVTSSSHLAKDLADVLSIPKDIFELENVSEVLSYEVWENILSEKDRNILAQFLPKEVDAAQALQVLFNGENFHFGNPLIKWGASLCLGNLLPDDVVRRERYLMANKKAYYSELQNYHNNMLENLRTMKDLWETSKETDMDITKQLWSSCQHVDNNYSSTLRRLDPEENIAVTGESCSWVTEDKVFNSKRQRKMWKEHGESLKRRGFIDRCGNSSLSRKEKKLPKLCTRFNDGTQYMSFVKITKKQHDELKRTHQTGEVKSNIASHVLGDLYNFEIHSYGLFEEGEQNKLHTHWLQLAKRDLPLAYAKWTEGQSLNEQWKMSLQRELSAKKNHGVHENEDNKSEDGLHHEQSNDGEIYEEAATNTHNSEDHEEEPSSYPPSRQQFEQCLSLNHIEFKPEVKLEDNINSTEDIARPRSPFQNHPELIPLDMDLRDDGQNMLHHESPISSTLTQFPPNMNSSENQFFNPLPEPGEFISTSQLPLKQSYLQRDELPYLMDSGNPEDSLVHVPSNLGTNFQIGHSGPFFSSYQEQDYFLQPDHKPLQYQFTAANDRLQETGHHHGHQYSVQQELRDMKERDSDMHLPVINTNIYAPHLIKEHVSSPMGLRNWEVQDPVRALQSHSNGTDSLWARNCYPNEYHVSGQFLNNGSHANDGAYSSLSQFNRLQPSLAYRGGGMISGGYQDISERSYINSGVVPNNVQNFQYTGHHQLNYLGTSVSGFEGGNAMKAANNLHQWINLPNQNSGLHESMGKQLFLRSWNQ